MGFGRKREKFSRPPTPTDIIPDARRPPPPPSVPLKITMASINGKTRYEKIGDCEQSIKLGALK